MRKLIGNEKNANKTIILIAVIVLIICIFRGRDYLASKKAQEAFDSFPSGMPVESLDEYMLSQKEVPSDIEGLSVYDKYEMGLERQEGSDTDKDGLTDKEEIEIYGSDPLKVSTSGDMYSDGYKVEHEMDLNTYYDYQNDLEFSSVKCPEVSVSASSASDYNAVVTDCTGVHSLTDYDIDKVYKAYNLYNYSGSIEIDMTELFDDYAIDFDDIAIYVTAGPFIIKGVNELLECKYSKDGNIAEIDYDFSNDEKYLVFITGKKNTLVGSIYNKVFGKSEAENMDIHTETGKALIYGSPFGQKKLYYVKLQNEKNNEIFEEIAMEHFDARVSELAPIDEFSFNAKVQLFDRFLPIFKVDDDFKFGISKFYIMLFFYSTFETTVSNDMVYSDTSTAPVDTGFNKNIDELPFQNFSSYIAEGGNCAGITHLSSYLYNNKELPTSGSYDCVIDGELQTIEWNLTNDNKNKTLYDAGLHDYKNKEFINENSSTDSNYIGRGLSDGEEQFVNMIGCFWAEGNDRISMEEYELKTGELYSVDMLKSMMKRLDEGKVVEAYMYMRCGGGHAVLIYGYEYVNDDFLKFYVYDCNLPQDREGYKIDTNGGTCMLQVFLEDDGEHFEYCYYPFSTNTDYLATSFKGIMKNHALVIMDENWNVMN